MVFKSILGATCTCLTVVSFNASAALLERLGGLAYYDTDADLTWLADASPNQTLLTWQQANMLAADLDVAGITGWRLPDTLHPDPSCGPTDPDGQNAYNCTGSELGNLFYNVLGGVVQNSISEVHNANYDLFTGIEDYRYWSATEYDIDRAWYFRMLTASSGRQNFGTKEGLYNVWAVHSGDVAVVPVPAAVWLFGSGLIGLVAVARRKKS